MELDTIVFVGTDTVSVELAMVELAARGDGMGWVNLGPDLDDEQASLVPEPSMLGGWFSSRGPTVPLATWTPPAGGRSARVATIGLEHGAGPKALDRLAESGVTLPPGWRRVQDHARRGLVVDLAAGVDEGEALTWLLRACSVLCPLDLHDRWIAEIHRP